MTNTSNHNYAVIMAGGEGTRFAPLSTPEKPKQFLNFIGDKTFIRQTFERVLPIVPVGNIYVSTNERYVGLVREQLPEINPENIIGEPLKKNTGPALAYCARVIHEKDNLGVMLCLPSDHHISNEESFRTALTDAISIAKDGYLVTLGMKPTFASPDLGYICPKTCETVSQLEKGCHSCGSRNPVLQHGQYWSPVSHFSEKPDKTTAQKYVDKGYLWNGGIFIWQTRVFLDEISKYSPSLNTEAISLSLDHRLWRDRAKGADGRGKGEGDNKSALFGYFNSVPSVSIDYAVMEKSRRIVVIPCEFGWSDVGTWEGLHELSKDGSVRFSAEAISAMNEIFGWVAPSKDQILPRRVEKPWGHEELWAHTEDYVGKILVINKPHRLSYQYHRVKEETIRVLDGTLDLECELGGTRKTVRLNAGDAFHIPPRTKHRMTAVENCRILETSTPYLADVIRIEDDYGRIS